MMNSLAVAPKLAVLFLESIGLTALRITTLPGHPSFSRVEIDSTLRATRQRGSRVWLESRRCAEVVIRELLGDGNARRSGLGNGVVVGVDNAEAERLIVKFAKLNGYAVIESEQIAKTKLGVAGRISAALDQMRNDGRLQLIDRNFKALATPRPPYISFLAAQLKGIAQLHPGNVPSLGALLRSKSS
jgi:hypothetical protein